MPGALIISSYVFTNGATYSRHHLMLGSELPRRSGELRENDGSDTAEDTRDLFLRHVPHVRLRARPEAQCWKDSTPPCILFEPICREISRRCGCIVGVVWRGRYRVTSCSCQLGFISLIEGAYPARFWLFWPASLPKQKSESKFD